MISKKLNDSINQQVVNEMYASNLYLAIACYMDAQELKVLASFYLKQSEEERIHALKLVSYLLDVGANVEIGEIPAPKVKFSSVQGAVEHQLAQEQQVTKQIYALMEQAQKDKDFAASSFLRWFVDEQVEEEASAQELLGLIKHAGNAHLLLVEDRLMKKGIVPATSQAPEG